MATNTSPTTTTPYSTVADIIRKQTEIEQRIAALEQNVRDTRLEVAHALEALAKDIGYPINNIPLVRQHIRDLAAKLCAGVRRG